MSDEQLQIAVDKEIELIRKKREEVEKQRKKM